MRMAKSSSTPLRSNLDTLLSMNLFVCAFTYAILLVYCIICLHLADSDSNMTDVQQAINTMQFYMDAVFPSTLTLGISMIVQNIIHRTERAGWLLPLAPIPLTIIYTMVCIGFRQIKGGWQFWGLMAFSVILVVGCFLSGIWIQRNADDAPPPGLGVTPS